MKTLSLEGIKEVTGKEIKPIALEKRVDEQLSKAGKYEVTENDTFKVEFSLMQKEGRWIPFDNKIEKTQGVEEHFVVFRMWTFLEETELRKKASSFDPVKRVHYLDNDILNRLKLQILLKEWSFEKDNKRMKLLHINGVLVDESYNAFMKLHPNIIRFIIERMNNILEYNG